MLPTIYKVKTLGNGLLSIMAKPVSGEWIEDEFRGLKKIGVDKIVSLLEQQEQKEVGLELEQSLCQENDIEFLSFPIADRGLPDTKAAIQIADKLKVEIQNGKHVVVHCRAGIGRTGIIAGAILVRSEMTANDAIQLISEARRVRIPDTQKQEDWLRSI